MKPYLLTGVLLLTITNAACSVLGFRSEESPVYEVLLKDDNKEIRRYQSYIAAKTTVQGEFDEAQNKAFRILAGYIFGNNHGDQKISMTAPVVVESPDGNARTGKSIAMTAPVMQEKAEAGWTMAFMMPAEYKMETLPKPKDTRIVFQTVPERIMATITYSWGRGAERNAAKAKELLDWLQSKDTYKPISAPVSAGYDPPWTLPFLRRNEMLVEIKTAGK